MQHRPTTPDVHGREGSLAGTENTRHTGHELPETPETDAMWREREAARIEAARAEREDR
jgi:hypothetical protein